MRKIWNIISIFGLVLLLLTQFNNCDVYSDNSLFNSTSASCEGQDCFIQSVDFLELRVNTDTDMSIVATTDDFNIGGDCNEGGFPQNKIIWELYIGSDLVRTSTGAIGTDISCDRGKFNLYVVLGPTSFDSTNRTGLNNPATSTRVQHILYIEIIGIDADGNEYRNELMARKRIYLNPI